MLHQHVNQLLREVLGDIRIAICHMGYEINQFPQRNNPCIGGCCWRGHENLAVAFILEMLGAEILDVGPGKAKIISSTAIFLYIHECEQLTWGLA